MEHMSMWQAAIFDNSSGLVFLTPLKTKNHLKHNLSSKNSCSLTSFCRNSKQYPLSFNHLGVFFFPSFFWCHCFTVLFTLTVVWPQAVVSLSTEQGPSWQKQEPGAETEENQKEKARRDQSWFGKLLLIFSLDWKGISWRSGLETCKPPPTWPFSFPSEWITVGKSCRLAIGQKRIMRICWHTALFLLSFCLCTLIWWCAPSWVSLVSVCIASAHLSWGKRKCQFAVWQLCVFLISKCCKV